MPPGMVHFIQETAMSDQTNPLTIYAPAPTTHQKCIMLDKVDDALGVFQQLGISGHEAAHHLQAFKAQLMKLPTREA